MMTSAQDVETSVNVTSNSPCQDYTHPDDHNLPNHNMTKYSLNCFYAVVLYYQFSLCFVIGNSAQDWFMGPYFSWCFFGLFLLVLSRL